MKTYYYTFYTVNEYEEEVSIIPEKNIGKPIALNKKIRDATYIGDLYDHIQIDRLGIKTIDKKEYESFMNKSYCRDYKRKIKKLCEFCDNWYTNGEKHESCKKHKRNIRNFIEKMKKRQEEIDNINLKRKEIYKKINIFLTNN